MIPYRRQLVSNKRSAEPIYSSRPGVAANPALIRLRENIAQRPGLSTAKHVERMHDYLWRQMSAYSYKTYDYYESHHAFRVLSRYLAVAYMSANDNRAVSVNKDRPIVGQAES